MRMSLAATAVCIAVATSPAAATASPHGDFERAASRTCPARDVASLPPAVLLDSADSFRSSLNSASRRRLDRRLHKVGDGGEIGICAGKDGAACDVNAYLTSFRAMGLTTRFTRAVCAEPSKR